jgi:hypothetical protein
MGYTEHTTLADTARRAPSKGRGMATRQGPGLDFHITEVLAYKTLH